MTFSAILPQITAAVIAFLVSLLLTPLAGRVAVRVGAVAEPGVRHVHKHMTPTAGGLAIFFAFWLAVAVTARPFDGREIGILVASLLLLALCLLDDVYGVHPAPRLVAQIAIAIIAYQWGTRVEGLTNPFSMFGGPRYIAIGWCSMPLTVLWIVFIINAINWLDGLDGLAAGVSAIAALTLGIMAVGMHMSVVAVMGAALAGACFGFLKHNFSPASIFMGDTGSMFLGFVLACLSVTGAFKSTTAIAVIVPLLILGVPIYDVVSTVLRRAKAGKAIYYPDKTHLHHRLLARGLTQAQAVLVMYGLTSVLCLAALGLWFR